MRDRKARKGERAEGSWLGVMNRSGTVRTQQERIIRWIRRLWKRKPAVKRWCAFISQPASEKHIPGAENSSALMWSAQARLWGRQNEGEVKTYPVYPDGLCENLYARPGLHLNRVCVIGAVTIHTSWEYALTYSACTLSWVRLFVTPWTVAHQTLLFLEFSRQEYWSGLPFPPPGDLPDPGNPHLLPWQVILYH